MTLVFIINQITIDWLYYYSHHMRHAFDKMYEYSLDDEIINHEYCSSDQIKGETSEIYVKWIKFSA